MTTTPNEERPPRSCGRIRSARGGTTSANDGHEAADPVDDAVDDLLVDHVGAEGREALARHHDRAPVDLVDVELVARAASTSVPKRTL